jgi:AraC-like DNA-binding protein
LFPVFPGIILAAISLGFQNMNLDFNWINLLILFGAVQGLIFAIILLFNKKHPGAGFLSLFMFVLAYNGFETFNWSSNLNFIFFDIFSFILIYAAGPSLYLYVVSLLEPERKFSRKTILQHYAIVIFQFVVRVGILVYHILWINKIINTNVHSNTLIEMVWWYAEPLSVLFFVGYLIASVLAFRKSGKTLNLRSISKEGQQTVFRWIKALLICMSIFSAAWVLTVLTPYFLDVPFDQHYYPIEIGLVLFIYWIAMSGYHRTKLIYLKASRSALAPPDEESEKLLSQLRRAMAEDKMYLDPELTLAKVSSHTGIPAKTISSILNQYHQTSFNDFVNDFRVNEVKERMIDPTNQHLTLSGIALESGFNSQATFQRAFKNSTGMSPRGYLNLQVKRSA